MLKSLKELMVLAYVMAYCAVWFLIIAAVCGISLGAFIGLVFYVVKFFIGLN